MALQRAREQRGGTPPVPADARRRGQTPAAVAAAQSWAELTGFEPDPGILAQNRIVTRQTNPHSIPFDRMSTKTRTHMRKNGWKRLAITSATPDCGKTLVAVNLALSLSRQPDIRTLLIEMDMRRPSLAAVLGARPAHDISEVLAGDVPFAEQALRIGDNLAVGLVTRPIADPGRMLQNERTHDVLREIEARYRPDLVIFDMPPLIAGAYILAFLGQVDCALAVARAGKSTVAQIDSCERDIAEQTNVLGIVLNECDFGDDLAGSPSDYSY